MTDLDVIFVSGDSMILSLWEAGRDDFEAFGCVAALQISCVGESVAGDKVTACHMCRQLRPVRLVPCAEKCLTESGVVRRP